MFKQNRRSAEFATLVVIPRFLAIMDPLVQYSRMTELNNFVERVTTVGFPSSVSSFVIYQAPSQCAETFVTLIKTVRFFPVR